MGQEGYIIRTGVGFDIDRAGAKDGISFVESIADSMNNIQMKKSVDGITKRNAALKKEQDKLEKNNEAATKKREKSVENSATKMKDSIRASLGKPPKAPEAGKEASKARQAFEGEMKAMNSSYEKFATKAKALGMKVAKAGKVGGEKGGFGTGQSARKFMKQDAEDRQRQINLTRSMIEENERIQKQGNATKAQKAQAKKDNKFLMDQEKNMIKMDKEAIGLEKKEAREKKKNYKTYKKETAKLHRQNKKELASIKARTEAYKKAGRAVKAYASGISSGLKNAFVIGTAAAAAFAYKLKPVADEVMKFEKTIVNANSVFGESNEKLHEVSDSLVTFGLQYGVSTNEAAEGLYQLASAGLSAAESQEVLQHTLKLAMATQGDHNTLAKLTVQTIKGFGFEMEDAEMLTDKFAHSIQKSLIEWQDLSSSVKFAMPFFVATGQSIDQLLGGLEVLTNRALEAGIAGRGLRQALAQFTKHAEDNQSAFRKMGIEILDNQGKMKELSVIAKEAQQVFGDVEDYKVLTAMLEDLNVRGATAFALLVQNADEYQASVDALATSAGEATRMADIQQQSLENQIQRVKNALMAPFFFSDAIGEAGDSLNEFTLRIKELVDEFVGFLIIEEEGTYKLTEMSYAIQDFVIAAMNQLMLVVRKLKKVFLETAGSGGGLETFTKLMEMSVKPMLMLLDIIDALSPQMLEWLVYYKMAAKVLPISTMLTLLNTKAQMTLGLAIANQNKQKTTMLSLYLGEYLALKLSTFWSYMNMTALEINTAAKAYHTKVTTGMNFSIRANTMAWIANYASIIAPIAALAIMYAVLQKFVSPVAALTIALVALAAAWVAMWAGATLGVGSAIAIAAMIAGVMAVKAFFPEHDNAVGSPSAAGGGGPQYKHTKLEAQGPRSYDMGGVYLGTADNGMMSTEHGLAQVQKGETINSKTGNMVGDVPITLNMGDVNVQDGEDFAERVAAALPNALRSATEAGQV